MMRSSFPLSNRRGWRRRLLVPLLLVSLGSGFVANCGRARVEPSAVRSSPPRTVLTGKAALGDWTTDAPGVRRRITTLHMSAPMQRRVG